MKAGLLKDKELREKKDSSKTLLRNVYESARINLKQKVLRSTTFFFSLGNKFTPPWDA